MRIKQLLMFLAFASLALAEAEAQHTMTATRLSEPIDLDGSASDKGWALATPVFLELEVFPAENTPARQKTEVRMAYTDMHLYVLYVCYDSDMSKLRAHVTERDKLWQDDFVSVILDTYGDQQKAYDFVVNPHNIQGDGLISQGAGGHTEDVSYELLWSSAASMNDSSWIVEMAIPFSSIRFPDKEKQTWRVYLSRGYPRETSATLAPNLWDKNNPCLLCQMIVVDGVEGIRSTTAVDVLPYVIGTQRGGLADQSDPNTGFQQEKLLGRAGIGLKVAPSPDLALEGVVNPDFSQIESDVTQISVNTTFALFYPERRPFFLEGSELFQPSVQGATGSSPHVFYSRTVNDPLVAGKVIGKSGSLSYAVLSASDRNTNLLVPGEEESDFAETGRTSLVNAARLRYNFGEASFIGGLASTRHLSGSGSNLVVGADWGYRFWDNYSFNGVIHLSRTEEPNDTLIFSEAREYGSTGKSATYDGDVLDGYAGTIQVGSSGRDAYFSLLYDDISPLFQAQNGFVARTNKRSLSATYGRVYWPGEGSSVVRFDVSATGGVRLNHQGIRKERFITLRTVTSLRGQIELTVGAVLNEERFRGKEFRNLPRLQLGMNSNPASYITFNFGFELGNFVFRAPSPERGYGHNLWVYANMRFTDRFRTSVSYERARLSNNSTRALYYDGNTYRVNATYHFNPTTSIRVITQYDTFAKNFNVYPLFSLRLNPFTVFYVGATRNAVNFGGSTGFVTTETNYFVKFQYLIQG